MELTKAIIDRLEDLKCCGNCHRMTSTNGYLFVRVECWGYGKKMPHQICIDWGFDDLSKKTRYEDTI